MLTVVRNGLKFQRNYGTFSMISYNILSVAFFYILALKVDSEKTFKINNLIRWVLSIFICHRIKVVRKFITQNNKSKIMLLFKVNKLI